MALPFESSEAWKEISRLARRKETVGQAHEACLRIMLSQEKLADRIAVCDAWNRIRRKVDDAPPPWGALLEGIPAERAREDVLVLANSRDKRQCSAAISPLTKVTPPDELPTILPLLTQLLKDPHPSVSGRVRVILDTMGDSNPGVVAPLIAKLQQSKSWSHQTTAISLAATKAGRARLSEHLAWMLDLYRTNSGRRQEDVLMYLTSMALKLETPTPEEGELLGCWFASLARDSTLSRDARSSACLRWVHIPEVWKRRHVAPEVIRAIAQFPAVEQLDDLWIMRTFDYERWARVLQEVAPDRALQAADFAVQLAEHRIISYPKSAEFNLELLGAQLAKATCLLAQGQPTDAMRAALEALQIADDMPDARPAVHVQALEAFGDAAHAAGDAAGAQRAYLQALALTWTERIEGGPMPPLERADRLEKESRLRRKLEDVERAPRA